MLKAFYFFPCKKKDFSWNSVKILTDSIYTSPVTHKAQYRFFIAERHWFRFESVHVHQNRHMLEFRKEAVNRETLSSPTRRGDWDSLLLLICDWKRLVARNVGNRDNYSSLHLLQPFSFKHWDMKKLGSCFSFPVPKSDSRQSKRSLEKSSLVAPTGCWKQGVVRIKDYAET